MHGHAAHGDIVAQMPAPFGQGDIQGLGRLYRVIEEHFIEIAHAVKQQTIVILLFYRQELFHHGRRLFSPRRG